MRLALSLLILGAAFQSAGLMLVGLALVALLGGMAWGARSDGQGDEEDGAFR